VAEGVSGWGGTMASAEHKPITGIWGQSRLLGRLRPPEAESTFGHWGACAPSGSAAYECKSLKNTQKEIKQ